MNKDIGNTKTAYNRSKQKYSAINPEISAYILSFLYGAALYIIQLLVPFYLHSQGFSAWGIGVVVASPGLFRFLFHPFAGAISDRIGERNTLLGSFTAITLAALCFSRFSSFTAILIIQLLFMSVSRTFYWPAIHSYSSRVDPLRTPHILGRAASVFGAGSMLGLGASGYLATLLGFERAFLFSALMGVLAVLAAFAMPVIPRKQEVIGAVKMVKKLVRLARIKQFFAGSLCGFVAALPFVLISSFYPVFLENEGLTKGLIGILSAVYNIGFISLGLIVGHLLERLGFRNLSMISMLLMGGAMIFVLVFPSFIVLLPVMLLLGVSTSGPNLIYQTVGSLYSKPEDRGAAIALSGYGFPTAFLVVPLITGFLVNYLGLQGVLLLIASLVLGGGIFIRFIFNLLGLSEKSSMAPAGEV
ncbi:MAG: MFS transporter [Bacillota bacterium]